MNERNVMNGINDGDERFQRFQQRLIALIIQRHAMQYNEWLQ